MTVGIDVMKAMLFKKRKHERIRTLREIGFALIASVSMQSWNLAYAAEQSAEPQATRNTSADANTIKSDDESGKIADTKGTIPPTSMDSKAQAYVRSLPKTAAVSAQKKEEIAKRRANKGPAEIQTLEEIKVRDRLDPEDYVAPKTAPMLAFRAKLDRQRPMTPQEITKLALCFIALCAVDTSKELKLDDRNEARAKDPPSFIFR